MSNSIKFRHVITGEIVSVKLEKHKGGLNKVVSDMILKYFVRAGKNAAHTTAEKFLLAKAPAIKEKLLAEQQAKVEAEVMERKNKDIKYKKVLSLMGGGETVTEQGKI